MYADEPDYRKERILSPKVLIMKAQDWPEYTEEGMMGWTIAEGLKKMKGNAELKKTDMGKRNCIISIKGRVNHFFFYTDKIDP